MSEDIQMVLEMFREWQKNMPREWVSEGFEPTFRGISIRWLMQQVVQQDQQMQQKAGEGNS